MEHESPIMKALREFALADPEDCDQEWEAYLALVNETRTSSVSHPTSSTPPLHNRVHGPAVVSSSSTTRSTASLHAPSGDMSSTAVSEESASRLDRDDVYPPLAELRRALMTDAEWAAMSEWDKDLWEMKHLPEKERMNSIDGIVMSLPAAQREKRRKELLEEVLRFREPAPTFDSSKALAPTTSNISTSLPGELELDDPVAPTPATCLAECPSKDAPAPVSVIILSTTSNSSTIICDAVPEQAAPAVSDKVFDVDAMGDTTISAIVCLPAGPDHNICGEDLVSKSQTLWSAPTSFSLLPGNPPSLTYEPMDVLEPFLGSSTSCSTIRSGRSLDTPPSLMPEAYMELCIGPNVGTFVPWPPPSWNRAITPMIRGQDSCHDAQQKRGKELLVSLDIMGNWNAIWLDVELKPPWPPLGVCINLPMNVCMIHTMVSLATWPMEYFNGIVASGKRNDTNCDIAQPVLISSEYVDLAIVSVPRMSLDIPFLISADVHQKFMGIYSVTAVLSGLFTLLLSRTEVMLSTFFQFATGNPILLLPWDPGLPLSGMDNKLSTIKHELVIRLLTAGEVHYLQGRLMHSLLNCSLVIDTILKGVVALVQLCSQPSWGLSVWIPIPVSRPAENIFSYVLVIGQQCITVQPTRNALHVQPDKTIFLQASTDSRFIAYSSLIGCKLLKWKIAWPLYLVFYTSGSQSGKLFHQAEVICEGYLAQRNAAFQPFSTRTVQAFLLVSWSQPHHTGTCVCHCFTSGTASTVPFQFLAYISMWSFLVLEFCQRKLSWDSGIARTVDICTQCCHVSCHLILTVVATELAEKKLLQDRFQLYTINYALLHGQAHIQAAGFAMDSVGPSLPDYLLQSYDTGHICCGGSASIFSEVLAIGIPERRLHYVQSLFDMGLFRTNYKLMAPIFDVVNLRSRVQAVQLHLKLIRSSDQGDTLSESFHPLVSLVLLSEKLQLSWDPGGQKFIGFFTQPEAKRRNVAAPAYYQGHCLDHANYFDKVCADQDHYLDVFHDQAHIGHKYYSGIFLEQVCAVRYLNLVKVCLDYGIHRDLGEVMKHQVPWDPGGLTWHRLEVKPNFKEGGLSTTCLHKLSGGLQPWALACFGTGREAYIGAERPQWDSVWNGTEWMASA